MKANIYTAKDGNNTLEINGKQIYSSYRPIESSLSYIEKIIDEEAKGYLLIGLGLGYHLYYLDILSKHKPIQVYCIYKEELEWVNSSICKFTNRTNIKIVTDYKNLDLDSVEQVIIPKVWLQLMGEHHPLYEILEDIKIKQDSFVKFKEIMAQNFQSNCLNVADLNLINIKNSIDNEKIACLVSSGPSLNQTVEWLKKRKNTFILCAGSALRILKENHVRPDAVIVSDPQIFVQNQLENMDYSYPLFYLSTANNQAINKHRGNKTILLQKGYRKAEQLADEVNYPLIDVGGSVATVGFSLLELLEFKKIVLFGQDFGFSEEMTHARGSTSGRAISKNENLRTVISNSGNNIFTTENLYSYLIWFNYRLLNTKTCVFNTAINGAKLYNTQVIQLDMFLEI